MVKKRIDKKIKEQIKDYVLTLKKDKLPISEVILFGSQAKGQAQKWSDIDLCIISPKFKGKIDSFEYLWTRRNTRHVKHMISPVGFHPKDFVDEDPLVWEIKKTGIKVV